VGKHEATDRDQSKGKELQGYAERKEAIKIELRERR